MSKHTLENVVISVLSLLSLSFLSFAYHYALTHSPTLIK